MVGDHQRQIAAQLAQLVRQQQIVEAVRRLAGEHRHARADVGVGQLPGEVEPRGQRPHRRVDLGARQLEAAQVPAQAHEEEAGLELGVLVGVQDVAAVLEHELGQRRHQAGAIAAAHQQRGGRGPAAGGTVEVMTSEYRGARRRARYAP